MKLQYEPTGYMQHFGYLTEECGEVLQAAGKTLRWGLESVNPEIPPDERESNEAWLRRELDDLEGAILRMRQFLNGERK